MGENCDSYGCSWSAIAHNTGPLSAKSSRRSWQQWSSRLLHARNIECMLTHNIISVKFYRSNPLFKIVNQINHRGFVVPVIDFQKEIVYVAV